MRFFVFLIAGTLLAAAIIGCESTPDTPPEEDVMSITHLRDDVIDVIFQMSLGELKVYIDLEERLQGGEESAALLIREYVQSIRARVEQQSLSLQSRSQQPPTGRWVNVEDLPKPVPMPQPEWVWVPDGEFPFR